MNTITIHINYESTDCLALAKNIIGKCPSQYEDEFTLKSYLETVGVSRNFANAILNNRFIRIRRDDWEALRRDYLQYIRNRQLVVSFNDDEIAGLNLFDLIKKIIQVSSLSDEKKQKFLKRMRRLTTQEFIESTVPNRKPGMPTRIRIETDYDVLKNIIRYAKNIDFKKKSMLLYLLSRINSRLPKSITDVLNIDEDTFCSSIVKSLTKEDIITLFIRNPLDFYLLIAPNMQNGITIEEIEYFGLNENKGSIEMPIYTSDKSPNIAAFLKDLNKKLNGVKRTSKTIGDYKYIIKTFVDQNLSGDNKTYVYARLGLSQENPYPVNHSLVPTSIANFKKIFEPLISGYIKQGIYLEPVLRYLICVSTNYSILQLLNNIYCSFMLSEESISINQINAVVIDVLGKLSSTQKEIVRKCDPQAYYKYISSDGSFDNSVFEGTITRDELEQYCAIKERVRNRCQSLKTSSKITVDCQEISKKFANAENGEELFNALFSDMSPCEIRIIKYFLGAGGVATLSLRALGILYGRLFGVTINIVRNISGRLNVLNRLKTIKLYDERLYQLLIDYLNPDKSSLSLIFKEEVSLQETTDKRPDISDEVISLLSTDLSSLNNVLPNDETVGYFKQKYSQFSYSLEIIVREKLFLVGYREQDIDAIIASLKEALSPIGHIIKKS